MPWCHRRCVPSKSEGTPARCRTRMRGGRRSGWRSSLTSSWSRATLDCLQELTPDYVVICSSKIETAREARVYYRAKLAALSPHALVCRGRDVSVTFEREGTHCFSKEPERSPIPGHLLVRRFFGHRTEDRELCLFRARAIDSIVPTIKQPALCHRGQGPSNSANWLLYGFPQVSGSRTLVVLRPGPDGSWVCVSAYPVKESRYADVRGNGERFPP